MMLRWTVCALALLIAGPALADAPMFRTDGTRIPGEYIVVFEDPFETREMADRLRDEVGGEIMRMFEQAIPAAQVRMTERQALATTKMEGVRWVEENALVTVSAPVTQRAPRNRGLDRIDQRGRELDALFQTSTDGTGVNVYVIDTGINPTHVEFEGRARVGADLIGDGRNGIDCNGHGSHVAGIAGSEAFGVAKGANIIAVRVFGCGGSTSNAIILGGIDWVLRNAERPAVANMSFGGSPSRSIDSAVNQLVGSGVFVAAAAGNEATDACQGSPARAASAFSVGATTVADQRANFSNFGNCVRLFAPGVQITSTWFRNRTDTNTISGTSMASPHVAGAAALLLEQNPNMGPIEVGRALLANATPGTVSNAGPGSPDLLLFVGDGGAAPPARMMSMPGVESFDNGAGPFEFQSDPFGTNAPQYASGGPVATGGTNNSRALRVRLGGVDNLTINNISGGFRVNFQLDAPSQVTLRFQYQVTQSPEYEADEQSIAAVSLDGGVVDTFGQVAGDGNGGAPVTTGLQARSVSLGQLSPGIHTLVIGGFNSKKTFANEFTDMILDDVSLSAGP